MAVTSLSSQSSIYSLVSNLMLLERQPVLKLQTRKSGIETLSAVYSDLKGKLSALRSAATSITDAIGAPMDARSVVSSDATVVTATAGSGAILGSHAVTVSQLAKHHTMLSDRFTDAGNSIVTALGAGDYAFSVTVNGVATQVSVTLAADDTDGEVLDAVASAINAAMEDVEDSVSATALNDTSTTGKLVLRSESTGLEFKMSLTDVTGTLLATLGIDDEAVASTETTGGYINADGALDAVFTVDGVSITRSSNAVSDVLNGITLNLRSTQEAGADAVTLSVSGDVSSVTDTVNDFISKYNTALSYLRAKSTTDAESGVRQPLSGQYTYRNLLTEMRTALAQSVVTGVAGIATLADIGITQDSTGSLSISDMDAFEGAVESDPSAVASLFTAEDGIATRVADMLEPFVKTGGYLDNDRTNTDARADALDESIERLEARLALREQQLIAQYSSLNEMLAQLSSQQDYLGSFLNSIGYY